ncbi:MAG TPA: hypothetical protein VIM51_08050 [Desulfosporosinus sp.]
MAVAIFVFIAWVIITVYLFVPRRLSTEENLLLFFFFTIITINIFTILDLNLQLIQHSNEVKMFISFLIHRNIIIPLALIIFVNLMSNIGSKTKKLIITVLIFLTIYLVNLVAFGIGLLTCDSSSLYLPSAIILAALMLIAFLTMKLVMKLPEGKSV